MDGDPTTPPRPVGWGAPLPPPPLSPPDHPRASTALILGIIGLAGGALYLPLLISPVALLMGRRAMREIDASEGALGGRGNAKAGFILGVIGTALLALLLVIAVGFVAFVTYTLSHAFIHSNQ